MAIKKFDEFTLADVPELFEAVDRPVHSIFWHCSASDNPVHDDARVMEAWHKARPKPFTEIGYNAFVRKDGTMQMGRHWRIIPAAQYPLNAGTLAFCLHGLKDENFTAAQRATMHDLSHKLAELRPSLRFRGHCEVAAKACPVVDYVSIIGINRQGYIIKSAPPVQVDTPTLEVTDKGAAVKRLQAMLNDLGASLVVDGHFGRATHEAVMKFQKSMGLTPDGIVGPLTWSALKAKIDGWLN
jgi:murein L,D-transpeptidase YcbB/YkuD